MSNNAPENVETDERFNSLTPEFLERALRLNLTATIRRVAIDSAQRTMPTMLMATMGVKPTVEELQEALLDAYTALAICADLSKLVDEIAPIQEVDDISEERKPEVKALIASHPMMKKAARTIKELVAELNGR